MQGILVNVCREIVTIAGCDSETSQSSVCLAWACSCPFTLCTMSLAGQLSLPKAQSKSITTDSTPLCNLASVHTLLVAIIKASPNCNCSTLLPSCCVLPQLSGCIITHHVCCHADTRGSALQEGCSWPWVVSHSLLPSVLCCKLA